jgi:hypothetical protein
MKKGGFNLLRIPGNSMYILLYVYNSFFPKKNYEKHKKGTIFLNAVTSMILIKKIILKKSHTVVAPKKTSE